LTVTLSVHDLALDRGGRRLFEGLSFDLQPGQALAVTGPNGAGKTSLLRALAGLLRPAEGRVQLTADGAPLTRAQARAALHWQGAADGLKPSRTAEAELSFWAEWSADPPLRSGGGAPEGGGGSFRPARGQAPSVGSADSSPASQGSISALQALGLADQARTEVRRLSTGQRRRLALARLLATPRPLWLLDEPLAPLDADWRARVGRLMQAHLDAGGLLVAAIHDPLPVPARELRLETA
jgi:heme exporter protein A